jgi:hypothetical protein
MFDVIKDKISDLVITISDNPFVEKIRSTYYGLPEREQLIVKVIGVVVGILIFFNIVYSVMSGISEREDRIGKMTEIVMQLDKLNDMVSQNQSELMKLKKLSKSSMNVSLFEIIEKQQNAANIKAQPDINETPKKEVEGKFFESNASVKYERITIRQLTNLLYGIEQNGIATKITFLKVKTRFDDNRYIDVEFNVTARVPK